MKCQQYLLRYCLFLAYAIITTGCASSLAGFQLQSSNDLPAGTPITLTPPKNLDCCDHLILRADGSVEPIAVQADAAGSAVFLLEAPLSANTPRKYQMIAAKEGLGPGPKITKSDKGLEISATKQPILTYNTATLSPPEGLPDYYKRSGFIHPFYTPEGKVVTDGFPVGHTHQHGIFFAWVNTTYRGDFTDFWNQQKETGTVAFRELQATSDGPVFAAFQSRHEHLSLEHGPVLDETWEVKTYRLPDFNVIDLTTRQKIIGSDTLFINQYHYGGMGIRLAAAWNEVDSLHYTGPVQVLTSQGISDREKANHSRPNWTAVYGNLDGDTASVALFDHPGNFRFPQPVRVHPSMPYFVLTPMVEEAFQQVPGQEYRYTYRILSFDGPPDKAALDALWQAYASKITIRWNGSGNK